MNLFQLENIINTFDNFIKQVCLFTLLSFPHENIYFIEVPCRHLKHLVERHKPMAHLRNKKGRYRCSCLSFEFWKPKRTVYWYSGLFLNQFIFFVMALSIHFYATALLWVINFEKIKYLLIIQLLFSCDKSYPSIANQWF